jgi:muramidase (phage lysozyme)
VKLYVLAAAGLIAWGAYTASRRMLDDGGDVIADEGGQEVADSGSEWAPDDGLIADAGDALTGAATTAREFIDTVSGGLVKISAMRDIDSAVMNHPNVLAMLRVIRTGEGTADQDGYRRIFGGQLFQSFSDHPRITVSKGGYTSSAAGAYQFLASTWDETRNTMGLRDFSPSSQDIAAVGRIAARGALPDLIAGRFSRAVRKIAGEWASLPGSPYGQPTISETRARAVYASAGGSSSDTIMA